MTRTERVHKLANAIKDYRGSYHPQTGKWIRGPQPHVRRRVMHWLMVLGEEERRAIARIDAFEFQDDMKKFLDEIAERKTRH